MGMLTCEKKQTHDVQHVQIWSQRPQAQAISTFYQLLLRRVGTLDCGHLLES